MPEPQITEEDERQALKEMSAQFLTKYDREINDIRKEKENGKDNT